MPIESSSLSYRTTDTAYYSIPSENMATASTDQKTMSTASRLDQVILSSQTANSSSVQYGRKIEEIYNHKVNEDYVSDENNMNYGDYLSVENLAGLTDDQKRIIKAAIKEAVTVSKQVQEYRNTPEQYARSFVLTKIKLDFIAEHVMPESYREQMLAANTRFIEDKVDQFNGTMVDVERSVHTWALGSSIQNLAASATKELEALIQGTSTIQSVQKQYLKAAGQVDESSVEQFAMNFKAALRSSSVTATDGLNQYLNVSLSDYTYFDHLTEDWNTFIDKIDGSVDYFVPTADHPLFDRQA